MARRRNKGRDISGVFLLDKHLGCSSNQVLQQVKRLYDAQKAGHTGALDPLATGMLPICLGEATKFSQYLLDADKTYEVTAELGVRTTTSDADGEVVETKPVDVSEQQLLAAMEPFKGKSQQIPSIYSALKYEGKPYYYYARQGIDIPRKSREITIFTLELLRFDGKFADMKVRCSKGTYIRSLVDDIGQVLGCGAYVTRLHRTEVANYPAEQMMSLETLTEKLDAMPQEEQQAYLDSLLLPVDAPVSNLPVYNLSPEEARDLSFGRQVKVSPESADLGLCRAYEEESSLFLGLVDIEHGILSAKRLVSTQ